jgi:hypothetical protein
LYQKLCVKINPIKSNNFRIAQDEQRVLQDSKVQKLKLYACYA